MKKTFLFAASITLLFMSSSAFGFSYYEGKIRVMYEQCCGYPKSYIAIALIDGPQSNPACPNANYYAIDADHPDADKILTLATAAQMSGTKVAIRGSGQCHVRNGLFDGIRWLYLSK